MCFFVSSNISDSLNEFQCVVFTTVLDLDPDRLGERGSRSGSGTLHFPEPTG